MKELNAVVVSHMDFTAKDGKHIKTTKLWVNICGFKVIDVNTELANDYELFTECKVTLDEKDSYRKDGQPNYKVVNLTKVK